MGDNVEETEIEVEETIEEPETLREKIQKLAASDAEELVDEPADDVYTPDFTYKIKDEVREFDEGLRPFITSKEQEERLRDLYTRADGLDTYKEKFATRDSEYTSLQEQAKLMTMGYETIKKFVDKNDVRSVAKAVGLSEDAIIDFVAELMQEQELPEEQRRIIQEKRDADEKLLNMQNQLNQLTSTIADTQVDRDMNELVTLMRHDAVSPVVSAMKELGLDFATEVIKQGEFEYKQTGVEPSVSSVVNKIASHYGKLVKAEETKTETNELKPEDVQKKTLPKVKGTSSKVVDQKITSLDDLRKLSNSIPVGGRAAHFTT